MSSFTSPLFVEILDTARERRVTARLLKGFRYEVGALGSGEVIEVPAGFVTDFASVPWGLWNIEPPLGDDAAKPAVVHDYLYATRGLGGRYSRAEADAIFREALKVRGVPLWKRTLLWLSTGAQSGPPIGAEEGPPSRKSSGDAHSPQLAQRIAAG